jgi:hypothetical protein
LVDGEYDVSYQTCTLVTSSRLARNDVSHSSPSNKHLLMWLGIGGVLAS